MTFFSSIISDPGCPTLTAPLNAAVSSFNPGKLAQMACRSGFYPDREIASLYVCINNEWTDPGRVAKLPLPDCLCKYIHYK